MYPKLTGSDDETPGLLEVAKVLVACARRGAGDVAPDPDRTEARHALDHAVEMDPPVDLPSAA